MASRTRRMFGSVYRRPRQIGDGPPAPRSADPEDPGARRPRPRPRPREGGSVKGGEEAAAAETQSVDRLRPIAKPLATTSAALSRKLVNPILAVSLTCIVVFAF